MVKVNTAGVSTEFTPFDPGDYEFTFGDYEINLTSKASGKPTCRFEFVMDDEDHPEYKGRKLWQTTSLQQHALWAFKGTAIALGADREKLEDPEGFETEDLLPMCRGARVTITCGIENYQANDGIEKTRNTIGKIKAA